MNAIVLIGPMAAGKTSVGKKLARTLGVSFVDTDKLIVREHGSIPEIFAERGEQYFRDIEAVTVRDAVAAGGIVSLGGGAVLRAETQTLLAEHTVVLIMIDEHTAAKRIDKPGRPLLADGGIEAWNRLLAEREPTYRALADCTINASRRPMSDIVDEITQFVREQS